MSADREWERIDDGETRPGWGLLLCGHPYGEVITDDDLGDFPPLVEARTETELFKSEADRNRRIAARLAQWCADLDATGKRLPVHWIQAAIDAINVEDGDR